MIDPATLLPGFVAGALLGALYLGVLWWSVRRLPTARSTGSWMLGTAAARIVLVVGGLGLLARLGPVPLASGAAGFLAVRVIVTRRVRAKLPPGSSRRALRDAPPSRGAEDLVP